METVYTFLNAPECVNNVYICFYLFQSTITVSRKPYWAGYQIVLCFLMFVYMLYLICDTLINYYLLTYRLAGVGGHQLSVGLTQICIAIAVPRTESSSRLRLKYMKGFKVV